MSLPLFRRNIKDTSNKTYLQNCIYDPIEAPDCPIFKLGDIVKWSGLEDYNSIALKVGFTNFF